MHRDTHMQNQAAVWAEGVARRLSFLQTSMAEESAEVRESKLSDEISKALQAVAENMRPLHLDALAERFPTWQMATVSFDRSKASPQTADELTSALCALSAGLSQDHREAIAEQLYAAGLAKETGEGIDSATLSEIKSRLKVSLAEKIDTQRLGRLFASLAETACTLDQLTWNIWRSLAPRSNIRREQMMPELKTLIRRSLVGEEEVSSAQIGNQLEKTRQLIASLLASLDAVGHEFAESFQAQCSPESIRQMVRADGKAGIFDNSDARAWLRYSERFASYTASTIETNIREHLVRHAEELARGENR